jgi:hypothetical protein
MNEAWKRLAETDWLGTSESDRDHITALILQGNTTEALQKYWQLLGFPWPPADTNERFAAAKFKINELRHQQYWPGPFPPCPQCGKALRTKLAKQCLECGADWHEL